MTSSQLSNWPCYTGHLYVLFIASANPAITYYAQARTRDLARALILALFTRHRILALVERWYVLIKAFLASGMARQSIVRRCVLALSGLSLLVIASNARAQDNYEIQVYGYELVPPRHTMVEVHSNFTLDGAKRIDNGLLPTNHTVHETLEITHGFNDWFECGFYVFTSLRSGDGWDWVGDHIRPRAAIPQKWHWPVGLSLSNEIGYQRRSYSEDTWTWEMRPIVDKQLGRWYLSFNPTFDRAIHGPNADKGFEFSPNFKISYDITRKIAFGVEYYGALGPVTGFDPISKQQQQIFPAFDLNLAPQWEVNFGLGLGVTAGSDHLIAKGIIGYRFNF